MFVKVLKIPEKKHWYLDPADMAKIKEIWGVYLFDPYWRVHICSFTPTYEMHPFETQIEFIDGVSDKDIDRIEQDVRANDSYDITYMNCHNIDNVKPFRLGWFPKDGKNGIARDFGFGMPQMLFKKEVFDPKDKAERNLREQRHDYMLESAREYYQTTSI